jgi:hypothetical protein
MHLIGFTFIQIVEVNDFDDDLAVVVNPINPKHVDVEIIKNSSVA